jgi:hypothetical protein
MVSEDYLVVLDEPGDQLGITFYRIEVHQLVFLPRKYHSWSLYLGQVYQRR